MKTIAHVLNFSHPLTEPVIEEIRNKLPSYYDLIFVDVPFQLDMEKPLFDQVDKIYHEKMEELGLLLFSIVAIIPPGFSAGALCLIQHMILEDHIYPKIIWLKRTDELVPRWILGGIE